MGRRLVGEIAGRFERKSFELVAGELMQASEEQVRRLYAVHQGKAFFEGSEVSVFGGGACTGPGG